MIEKLVIITTAVFATLVLCSSAFAGFDLGGIISAGTDLTKAATLSDGEVKQLASEASNATDNLNKVAPSSSTYAKRIANLTKGMKYEGNVAPKIKVYMVKDVNAFAMADGTVRVCSGLMEQMSDDEVRY